MSNEKQIAYWNEVAGPKWVRLDDAMNAKFANINELLLSHAAARPGEAVLDIGCGTGTTAFPFASAVTPGGHVTGIDVSEPMLQVARRRSATCSNVIFLSADAQSHNFGGEKFNVLASRFGVMFFTDPVVAFTNLRSALAEGGRLCFVCWAPLRVNPHWQIPFDIVVARLGLPQPRHPHAPGPLAFSDSAYVQNILTDSGFSDIQIVPTAVPIIGETLEEEARIACILGPAAALLDEKKADDSTRSEIRAEIAEALRVFLTPQGMISPATVHLVTARK
jgi:SAM-dependent methyltransferase